MSLGVKSAPEDANFALESLAWDNLWSEAYGALNGDPEYTKLLAKFENYVTGSKDVVVDGAVPILPSATGPA